MSPQDSGFSWSNLAILAHVPGVTTSQPTPVFDNLTGTLHVAFNSGGAGIAQRLIMSSTDDGLNFGQPEPLTCTGGRCCARGRITANIGLGRGLVVKTGGGQRLILPSENAPLYSDDSGKTWQCGNFPSNRESVGENSIARCTGEACGGQGGFAMVMRESMTPLGHPTVSVAFSANAVDWGNATLVTSLTQFSNYSQAPGLAAVDGGLLLAHGGGPGNGVTGPGTNARRARHGDSGGADLLFSRDGLQWRLLKRLWPMTGGYCTLEELEVDSHGAATKFGVLFEGGVAVEQPNRPHARFMNFTWPFKKKGNTASQSSTSLCLMRPS